MSKDTAYPKLFMVLALLVLVLALLPIRPVFAAPTFNVNSTLDQPDDLTIPGTCHTAANTCTLRAAIMQANRTSGLGATIILPAGVYSLTIPFAGADGEENGDLNLNSPVTGNPTITITGSGAGTTIIDANQIDRVFHVHRGRWAAISDVTIRNGYVSADDPLGGGVHNEGRLTVSSATISGNHSDGYGGGIYNDKGYLTVMNSALSQNAVHQSGGGIYNYYGQLTVVNSTLSWNTADQYGGGIANVDGDVNVSNSAIFGNGSTAGGGIYSFGLFPDTNVYVINGTISQNYANDNGGGIYMSPKGLIAIYNTSVIDNDADHDRDQNGGIGGGVYSEAGSRFIVVNTLIAANTILNAPIDNDCDGDLEVYGWNLLGDETGCTFSGNGTASRGFIALYTIGPLHDNGGPTWTHALLPGSAAIDTTIDSLGCVDETGALLTTDQRGAVRPVGPRCDVGAYEYVPALTLKSIAANDGWVLESTEASGLGGPVNSAASTFRLGDDAGDKQYRDILSFNTGTGLPDNAVITKATLKFKQQSIIGGDDPVTTFRGFMVDIKKGFFGTAALEASDFQTAASKTYGPFRTALSDGWYSIDLSNGKAYINKLAVASSLTQIRLRFKFDDNNNARANYLSLFSGNAPAASRPQLIIEYYLQ